MHKSKITAIPKLSVLVPSYNDSFYVRQCLESILASSRNDIEIIVSDDCSDRETLKILDQFSDDRLTVVTSDVRLGAIENWKKCLAMAQGQWVHFLATDDYYSEDAIESILENLKEKDTVYLIAHKCFEDGSNDIFEVQCNPVKVNNIFGSTGDADWVNLLKFFNHDELVLSIFPRSTAEALFRLSKYSVKSSFIYWVVAIFYKRKISFIQNGAIMKRYRHKIKRSKSGEVGNAKISLGYSLMGFCGDIYNSVRLALHFRNLSMLLKLLFYNRYHGIHKGGFYGFFNEKKPYFHPGPIVNLLLGPIILMARKFSLHKKFRKIKFTK
jgi:glycosyltransferase involved in cell wall biosynthesis